MIIKKLLDEFDEEIIKAFVQKNADYYLIKWKLMANSGSKFSWNWAAFLLGGFWILYRKMYVNFFILLVVSMIISLIPIINVVGTLIIWLGVGIFGNYMYGQFVYSKLTELKLIAKSDEELKQLALLKGGTSMLAPVILFIILIILEIIVIAITGSISGSSYY